MARSLRRPALYVLALAALAPTAHAAGPMDPGRMPPPMTFAHPSAGMPPCGMAATPGMVRPPSMLPASWPLLSRPFNMSRYAAGSPLYARTMGVGTGYNALDAIGVPNDRGRLSWPLALRILPPALEARELRERAEVLVRAAAT